MNAMLPDDKQLERMQAAADWLVRLNDAPADETVVFGWLRWCEEDAENLPAFQRTQGVWQSAAQRPSISTAVSQGQDSSARTIKRAHRSRAMIALAASITFAAAPGYWLLTRPGADSIAHSYATSTAALGSSVLPDGSKVELGARSRITTNYSAKVRSVAVEEGEAFFTVNKDPLRPFVVIAGGMQITAIGTAFNVRRGDDRIVVTVGEGKVRIDGDKKSVPIEAGQQAVYIAASRSVAVAEFHRGDTASWRQGVLKYEHEPLSNVTADLNRYSDRQIVLIDPEIGHMPFTGTVFSARIEDALHALEDVFPLKVVEHKEKIELQLR